MTSEQQHTSPHPHHRRRRNWAVGSIAAAVLLAGGGTAYWASSAYGGSGGGRTDADRASASLRAPGSPQSTEPSAPGIAPGEPDPSGGGVTYEATGPLPQGPKSSPRFKADGEVTKEEVARLAAALGIEGEPRLSGEQWQAGEVRDSSGPRLTVTRKAPGTWTYTHFQLGGGDNCQKGKDSCGAIAPPEGDPGKAVSEEAAKKAAGPVLAAVGQNGAALDARLTQGAVRVVAADPVVGGLPTQGWTTKVNVGADGQVVGGSGELKAPVQAGEAVIVPAEEALKRLNARSGPGRSPAPSGCATSVPLEPDTPVHSGDPLPCNPEPRPIKPPRTEQVRAAVVGLAPGTVDGVRGLVPAWLFEVAGKGGGPAHTVAQPAVEEPKGDGGAGTVPGFSYSEGDRKLTVNFWGGACSDYGLEVRESAQSVLVKIIDTPRQPGRACILIAEDMSLTAKLEQPLGDRKVIDVKSGQELPRQS
ncbi:hypothetical protein [Streptomyces sp. WAC06614]|uniref:hypothetical protein n=1 Tax=Streptomyces sp. WAC06614 TaxID=2487416 RepID=UPI000F76B74A|nr:hypothetical protein [Streptomyces sp. WAC06614]RSS83465.1 hypothetical protein EF918_03725 [Streptomyces sp. WAC06614]